MNKNSGTILTDVVEKLSMANTLPAITQTVASAARTLSGADGATFVLRDQDHCFYADETAISPLWKGRRFPLDSCISGWAMNHRQVVVIDDIYKDSRIPHDAYRPTFVKSLCMVPIRAEAPMGAIGNYWANGYCPGPEEIKLLQVLANSAAIALENFQLKESLKTPSKSDTADREKEFETAIHTLAHDLRNPLSTMMLFTELLQNNLGATRNQKLLSYIESILKTGRHANEQIRKMLSLYSVRNKKIEKGEVNLSAMVYELAEQLKAQAAGRDIQFEIESGIVVLADLHLIRLALENILGNAVKYSARKPQTRIQFKKLGTTNHSVLFYVKDNGDGFHSEDAHKLFRPMGRLHTDAEFAGTGLGLASSAKIIEMHGGHIRAEGVKGQGATFYFELPTA
jgi:signal transduction histidine kinase